MEGGVEEVREEERVEGEVERSDNRFDGFSGVELGCIAAGLAMYGLSHGYQGQIAPMSVRDALVAELSGSVNFGAGAYPDLSGMNVGSSIS